MKALLKIIVERLVPVASERLDDILDILVTVIDEIPALGMDIDDGVISLIEPLSGIGSVG